MAVGQTILNKAKPKVLLPLYQYPLNGRTWAPLYKAISSHPNVEFLVVVNPNSGPFNGTGREPLPGRDYVREISKLTKQSNVCAVGYILVDYCKKPVREVLEEIKTYADWAKHDSALGMRGILLDATPNHYRPEFEKYLDEVNEYIKTVEGISGERLVIHNPGTPPDYEFGDAAGVDVVITCEEPYEKYVGEGVQNRLKELHYNQPRSGYMISGVPKDGMVQLMQELKQRGSYLFATGLVDDFYESFGECWSEFVSTFESA